MNYKELICLQQTKVLVLTTQKKDLLYERKKKTFESLLGEKYFLGKPVHILVKNTANNADTWGFIQQFFQHLYRTANLLVHLIVWIETAEIHWYRLQHILQGRIQHCRVVLGHLVVKVETAQIHRYR